MVSAIFFRFGSLRAKDSAKCKACPKNRLRLVRSIVVFATLGNLNEHDAKSFHEALALVTSCTLFGLERLIAHRIGKPKTEELTRAFLAADKNRHSSETVFRRNDFWL